VPKYERDGLDLHYTVVGHGPDVLCVHGATGAGVFEWSTMSEALGDRYRFVLPDLRGHGFSDHRAGAISIEEIDEDLLELVAHERVGPTHLLGFSFGAEVVLDLELRYPGTARSLLLLSPGLGDPKSSVPSRARLEAVWPDSLRRLHRERHGEDHWLGLMLEICDRAALRPKANVDELAAIACPILAVVGSKDDPRRIRQTRVLEESHPRCRVVVVEGAIHAVHKERPGEVAQIVGEFLDDFD
jgi:pimeloyl-ACP methyl ester carboxylesterase